MAVSADVKASHPSFSVKATEGGSVQVLFASVKPQSVLTPLPESIENHEILSLTETHAPWT